MERNKHVVCNAATLSWSFNGKKKSVQQRSGCRVPGSSADRPMDSFPLTLPLARLSLFPPCFILISPFLFLAFPFPLAPLWSCCFSVNFPHSAFSFHLNPAVRADLSTRLHRPTELAGSVPATSCFPFRHFITFTAGSLLYFMIEPLRSLPLSSSSPTHCVWVLYQDWELIKYKRFMSDGTRETIFSV